MSGVALYCLDIAAAQLKFVRCTECPKRMKDYVTKPVVTDKLFQPLVNTPETVSL